MRSKPLLCFYIFIASCFCANHTFAQECGQLEYRLLATTKGSTLEKELNEIAKQGFRFEREAQAIGMSTFTVLASRPHNAEPKPRFEYKTLNVGEFKKQKQELAAQGYSYRAAMLPSTLAFTAPTPVFLLERELGVESGQYEYDFVASPKDRKLQTLLDNANSGGFVPIGILGGIVVLRRDQKNPAVEMGRREYLLLETYKISTLEKEVNAAAQDGYRFFVSSQMSEALLARDYKPKDQGRYEYRLVSIRNSDKAISQLNELSKQGYVLRAATGFGLTAIMERLQGSTSTMNPLEFKALDTRTEDTMQKELAESCTQGFIPISLSGGSGRFLTLMAREVRKGN